LKIRKSFSEYVRWRRTAENAKMISANELLFPVMQDFLSEVEEKWAACMGKRNTCPFVNFPWHDTEQNYSSSRNPPMDVEL
jgi:hypothetical protein